MTSPTAVPPGILEGKGLQRLPQKQFDWRLEKVAEAVRVGYCRLQMPLKLALGVRETLSLGLGWAPWKRMPPPPL